MSNPDWDRIAEAYSGLQTDTRQEFLFPALLSCLPGNSDLAVLDYGCGCGDFSKLLGKRYQQVICFDTSEVMLKRAEEKVKQSENIYTFFSDPKGLPRNGADFAVANLVLQTLRFDEDVVGILRSIHPCLKERGTLYVGMTHPCFNLEVVGDGEYRCASREQKVNLVGEYGPVSFTDYHRSLEAWFRLFSLAGWGAFLCSEVYDNEQYYIGRGLKPPRFAGRLPLFMIWGLRFCGGEI